MRLWSIHPSYLDQKGLCGVWREGLLAQYCLLKGEYQDCPNCSLDKKYNGRLTPEIGDISFRAWVDCPKCKGTGEIKTPYWNHPQLDRFKRKYFKQYISWYLLEIYEEGYKRKYNFDKTKILDSNYTGLDYLTINNRQLIYEFNHLQDKLFIRDKKKMELNFDMISLFNQGKIKAHPLFTIIDGDMESWEKVK